MTTEKILEIFSTAILLILQLAAPFLLISLGVGLLISIFQAATQINEQTLTFVPKIVSIALMLLLMGSWILSKITDFFAYLTQIMAGL